MDTAEDILPNSVFAITCMHARVRLTTFACGDGEAQRDGTERTSTRWVGGGRATHSEGVKPRKAAEAICEEKRFSY